MGTYLKSIYKLGDKKRLSAVGRQPTLATPGHGPAPQAGGAAVGTGLGPASPGARRAVCTPSAAGLRFCWRWRLNLGHSGDLWSVFLGLKSWALMEDACRGLWGLT